MNYRTLKRAIGVSNGKGLILQNDCGSVCITQNVGPRGGRKYTVETDGFLDRTFDTLEKAVRFAVYDLATSMDGSPNR